MSKNTTRILVTGAGGQLGQALKHRSSDFLYEFLFVDRSALDITSTASVERVMRAFNPDVIINAAAYTQVDLAESEREKAFAINETGVKNLVDYALKNEVKLIHISTDYVFRGGASKPYKESHKPSPNTVYGASKLAGEEVILNSGLQTFWILRTSWLYSDFGKNFYKTIAQLAQTKESLNVVDDQSGAPTQAADLAYFILRYVSDLTEKNSGIYHFSNSGRATWYDFAKEIVARSNREVIVHPVTSAQFPTAAKRPAYSLLDNSKIQRVFGFEIRQWRDAID